MFILPRALRGRGVCIADFDLVTIAALAQTIVLAVTMVILIFQLRSQEKSTKEAAYQKVLDDYNDVIQTLVGRPELGGLMDEIGRANQGSSGTARPTTPQERLFRGYFMMVYGLLERVYILYDREWIDANTWKEWEAWLAVMAKHPTFGVIHTATKGMFNRSFQEHVDKFVPPSPGRSTDEAREP